MYFVKTNWSRTFTRGSWNSFFQDNLDGGKTENNIVLLTALRYPFSLWLSWSNNKFRSYDSIENSSDTWISTSKLVVKLLLISFWKYLILQEHYQGLLQYGHTNDYYLTKKTETVLQSFSWLVQLKHKPYIMFLFLTFE